jgi:hypothetical protein
MAQATAPILDSTIASFRCAAKLVGYWTNNGQRLALSPDGSVVIDPQQTSRRRATRRFTGFDQ